MFFVSIGLNNSNKNKLYYACCQEEDGLDVKLILLDEKVFVFVTYYMTASVAPTFPLSDQINHKQQRFVKHERKQIIDDL